MKEGPGMIPGPSFIAAQICDVLVQPPAPVQPAAVDVDGLVNDVAPCATFALTVVGLAVSSAKCHVSVSAADPEAGMVVPAGIVQVKESHSAVVHVTVPVDVAGVPCARAVADELTETTTSLVSSKLGVAVRERKRSRSAPGAPQASEVEKKAVMVPCAETARAGEDATTVMAGMVQAAPLATARRETFDMRGVPFGKRFDTENARGDVGPFKNDHTAESGTCGTEKDSHDRLTCCRRLRFRTSERRFARAKSD